MNADKLHVLYHFIYSNTWEYGTVPCKPVPQKSTGKVVGVKHCSKGPILML